MDGEPVGMLEDVWVRFRGFLALREVSLAIPRGLTLVVGPNGSGKSTLVKTLLGFLRPWRGRVRLLGEDPLRRPGRVLGRVTYVSEQDGIPPDMRVETFLSLLEDVYGSGVRRAAEALGLYRHRGKRYRMLSRGYRRRLALVEALGSDRELVIIDDPMIGMDSRGRETIARLVRERVAGGQSFIVVSHIPLPGARPDCLVAVEDGVVRGEC